MTRQLRPGIFRPVFMGQGSFSVEPITLAINHDEIDPRVLPEVLRNAVPKGFVGTAPYVVKTLDGEYLVAADGTAQFFPLGRSPLAPIDVNGRTRMAGAQLGQFGEKKCYKCGMNEPHMLYTSVGDPNPLCEVVDETLCGLPGTVPTPLPGTPVSAGGQTVDVHMEVPIGVHLGTDMSPLQGARVVARRISADGSESDIAEGVTDVDGKYVFKGTLQIPIHVGGTSNPISYLRFKVHPTAETPSFPVEDSGFVRLWQELLPQHLNQQIAVCPYGTHPIVCEVAKRQAMWKQVLIHQGGEWGFQTPQHAGFANDTAHAAVRDMVPQAGGWAPYWIDIYSFWVGDLGIPPKDWPKMIERSVQVFPLFTAIPFPEWQGIEDYFQRCAKGVPIAQGKDGSNYAVYNPRLYSDTFSDYFPRADVDIERDMAIAYVQAIPAIIACMVHKIKQKVKELERTMRTMSLISFSTIVAFSPLLVAAGPAGFSILATETMAFTTGGGEVPKGVTTALAVAMLAAGNTDFVVAALEPAIAGAMEDLDPLAQQAISAAYPQLIDSAVEAVIGPAGIGSGVNTVPAGYAVGSAAVAMAIKMIASIAKGYAARRIEEFADAPAGVQQASEDILAFAHGKEVSPYFAPFIQWVVEKLDLTKLFDDAIDQFLDEFLEAWEAGNAQGGSVAVVPEEGGGGLAFVPTDSEGTPVDTDGNPLPGGMAPQTTPEIPSSPEATVATVVGVGGAAAVVLALTGVIS